MWCCNENEIEMMRKPTVHSSENEHNRDSVARAKGKRNKMQVISHQTHF